MDMQPIEPNKPLSVTLTAEQWNVVMAALNELPHRVARPIVDASMAQLRQQALSSRMSIEDVARVGPDGP